ncbi:MAG: hypothetical protein ACODAJ_08840 [Planctomycetota bacterium]
MRGRWKALLVPALVGAVGGCARLPWGRPRLSKRERAEQVAYDLEQHLEAGDPAAFCSLLTKDYQDNYNHDRATLQLRLREGLPFFDRVAVDLQDVSTTVEGQTAEIRLLAVARVWFFARERPRRWRSQVTMHLVRRRGRWLVRRATYALPKGVAVRMPSPSSGLAAHAACRGGR